MEEETKLTLIEESSIENEDWYKSLLEDCQAIMVEHEFTARMEYVRAYHELGKRILEEKSHLESVYGKKVVKSIAERIKKSEESVWKAQQFYEKFPDLEAAPFGKDISWWKITQKYLPNPEKVKPVPQESEGEEEVKAIPTEKPVVEFVWSEKHELWYLSITKENLDKIDVFALRRDLDGYISSIK